MKTIFRLLAITSFLLLFASCDNDDSVQIADDTKFDNGFFVSGEGNFGSKNGSVSYIENDFSTVTNLVVEKVNDDIPVAGLIQSIAFGEQDSFLILNDANTIIIVDKVTLKRKGIVTSGLQNPRYMAIIGNKGYITNWGDGANTEDDYLAVLDLETGRIEPSTISLANGVEQIVASGNKLYVSHLGGFTTNNIVSVIDTANGNSVETIKVKDNPDDLFFTEDSTLVVLSKGNQVFNADFTAVVETTTSAISFIDVSNNMVTKEITFPTDVRGTQMDYENGKIYYYSGTKVFEISPNATNLAQETSGIEVGSIFGMSVRNNELFTVSPEFTKFSRLTVTDLDTKTSIFSASVAIGASKIYFN